MADLGGFDANAVQPAGTFEAIPAGNYEIIITDSQLKPTKAGTGQYLELKIQILNGPYQNRILWDRLNINNPSEKAVEIARGTLSAICRAVGVMTPKASAELHNKPLSCSVKLTRDQNDNPQSDVRGYKKRRVERAGTRDGNKATEAVDTAPWDASTSEVSF